MENKQQAQAQAHEQKNEVSKKPSLLRNIFVVFMFVLASIGTSMAAYEFIFSNFIENIFISVALGILLGTGFMYFILTLYINIDYLFISFQMPLQLDITGFAAFSVLGETHVYC